MMKKGFKWLAAIMLVCMLALPVGCLVACNANAQPGVTVTFAEEEITMTEWSSKDIVASASDSSAITLSVSDPDVLRPDDPRVGEERRARWSPTH